jgi:hypothetical protein
MKTAATIQPTRSAGVAMAILGVVILFVVLPFSVFGLLNFNTNLPILFFVVPVVMGFIGIGSIVAGVLQFTGKVKFGRVIEAETSIPDKTQSSENRLDELERLKRRDMVTPEEYAVKRQEILKDL